MLQKRRKPAHGLDDPHEHLNHHAQVCMSMPVTGTRPLHPTIESARTVGTSAIGPPRRRDDAQPADLRRHADFSYDDLPLFTPLISPPFPARCLADAAAGALLSSDECVFSSHSGPCGAAF
jgi:hypothetical protein